MGITALGYLGLKASNMAGWQKFATETLGIMPAEPYEGGFRFRIDSQAWRIAIEEGAEDDIAYAGFEVAGHQELAVIKARLESEGVEVNEADADLAKLRGVMGLLICRDPEGLQIEIYYGATQRKELPFVSPASVSGFVAEDQGLGHIVLFASDIAAARHFYSDLLGFKLSDSIDMQISPELTFKLEFYHCNPRHHTVALVPTQAPKRLQHFMLQTATFDDVGFALDRCAAANVPLTATLGRHTNDEMVSFYVSTPSGFDVEYGWGALQIQGESRVMRHDKISVWGHHQR